jgi:hypothetical protein
MSSRAARQHQEAIYSDGRVLNSIFTYHSRDDSPRLQGGGFWNDTALSSQGENIQSGIQITIERKEAAGTLIHTLTQGHPVPMVTPAALLTGIGWIDFDGSSASFFRFAEQLVKKARPRRVLNAFDQTMSMNHTGDVQVLHTDHPEASHDLSSLLVGEIVASERDTLMHTSNSFAMLAPLWRAFRQFAMLALHFGKGLFFLTEEARVLNFSSIRECGKGLESNIDPDLGGSFWQALRLTFNRKGHVPFAGTTLVDGAGFDLAFDGTMIDHLHRSDFGECHAVIMGETKAALGIGEAVVAPIALKAGIPWLRSCFAATEKGFEGQVNPNRDILQDLGVDMRKCGAIVFQSGIGSLLSIAR